jgi:hypothetical protein
LRRTLLHLTEQPVFAALGRAGEGGLIQLGLLALLATALTAFVIRMMARTFVTGAQDVAVRSTPRRTRPHRWTEGLTRVIFRKELRLLARHPLMLNQIFPMVLLVGVMGVVLLSLTHESRLLAPLCLYWAGLTTLPVATAAASGEVGWDLVRQSAVPEQRVRVLKTVACVVLCVGPVILACLWLAGSGRPWLALLTLAMALACGAASSWLGIITTKPSPRQDVITQTRGRALVFQFVAMGLSLSGAAGVALVAYEFPWFGALLLGIMLLGVLGCFTLVEPESGEAAT